MEKKIKILLIEDSADDAFLIKRKLENSPTARYDITAVQTLQESFERMEDEMPDLIISDLGLPDSHGLDTVRQILSKAPQVPLVVLSGFDDKSAAIKAVQAGAQDYMVKGQIEYPQMERSLHYSIERSRLQAELEKRHKEILNYQSNLYTVLDKNADAILVVGADWKILFTNPAAALLMGRRQKDLIKEQFKYEMLPGKTVEIEIAQPDKSIKTAEMNTVEIDWEGSRAYLVSIHEITQRKKMETALKNSEEKFAAAFRASPDMISIVNLETGKFIEVNDAYARGTGYRREELIGRNAKELDMWVDPEDEARMERLLQEKGSYKYEEFEFRLRSGKIRCWLCSAEIFDLGTGRHIMSIAIDITERKEMAEATAESEEKFSRIFQHNPEVILITEITDGTVLDVNDAFLRRTGYNREEVIGRKTTDFGIWCNPEDRQKMVRAIRETGKVNNHEYVFRMKSGELRTWLLSGEVLNLRGRLSLLTVTNDITERKLMEERLRFSDMVLKSIHEGVIVLDTNYKITYWNEMSENIFQIKAQDAVGKFVNDVVLMVEESQGQNAKRMQKLLEIGFNREEQIYRTSHGDIWVDVQSQKIENNGQLYGWLTLVSDISERKKAAEALKHSEAKYRELIDTSGDAIISADSRMNVTIWNKGAQSIFGYSEKEMLGHPVQTIIPEIMRKGMTEGFAKFTRTGESRILNNFLDLIGIGKDGREIPVELSVSGHKDGDSFVATAIIRDVTQRREAEKALKQSEEKYRELINTTTDAIVTTDENMVVTLWNPGAQNTFGYTEQEMLGKPFTSILPEEDRERILSGYKKSALEDAPGIGDGVKEFTAIRKDGTQIPVEISMSTRVDGASLIATGIMRDITQRKKAEEELKHSEEKYRELVNTSNDSIFSLDSKLNFILWNAGAEKLLGYTEDEIFGESVVVIFPTAERSRVTRELLRVKHATGKIPNLIFETEAMKKDCALTPVDISISTRQSAEGPIYTAIMRDITVRKEAEKKLRQIDQMKTEFLSNVSHELRTPLQSVSGFTKLIMNGEVPDKETQQEFLQIIDRETQHLGNLINGLLDMSRLEVGSFKINRRPTSIREIVSDTLKMLESLARQKSIKLTEDIPQNLPQMNVDNERIRQVFINLVGNAIKFSDPDSSIAVKAEIKDGDFIFHVADHGTGIREENMKHLFERFYREEGETVRGGTGLGLYISKQIVEAHGGRIWAESKVGKGSTFSFSLPLTDDGGKTNG